MYIQYKGLGVIGEGIWKIFCNECKYFYIFLFLENYDVLNLNGLIIFVFDVQIIKFQIQ